MVPLQIPGIAIAGCALLTQYRKTNKKFTLKRAGTMPAPGKPKVYKMKRIYKAPDLTKPFKSFINGLSSTLSNISYAGRRVEKENYSSIVKDFIPGNAVLLKPERPFGAAKIQLVDLDGDSHNEIIASYKDGSDIQTILLKKDNGIWIKIAEVRSCNCDTVSYRGFSNITGEKQKQLLLGVSSEGKPRTLYVYSLKEGTFNEIFSQDYYRFGIIKNRDKKRNDSKPQLALWYKNDSNSFDIDLLEWNNSAFKAAGNVSDYYYNEVVPYCAGLVKQSPYSPDKWYCFADALFKAQMYRDSLTAIQLGMSVDKNNEYTDKFKLLQNDVRANM